MQCSCDLMHLRKAGCAAAAPTMLEIWGVNLAPAGTQPFLRSHMGPAAWAVAARPSRASRTKDREERMVAGGGMCVVAAATGQVEAGGGGEWAEGSEEGCSELNDTAAP